MAEPSIAEGLRVRSRAPWAPPLYLGVLALAAFIGARLFAGDPPSLSVKGRRGAVATASPEASAAGASILRAGGNAADAFVAASFAVSVTRPQSTGLGGGGFLLYRDAAEGKTYALDFREVAGEYAGADRYLDAEGAVIGEGGPESPIVFGASAAGVPGVVAGLVRFHERFGSLPLPQVMAPAIRLAEGGFKVDSGLAAASSKYRDQLARFPSSAAVYLKGGRPLRVGELLVQPELGFTLRAVAARGRAGFYEGWVAERIAQAMRERRGLISRADLSRYEPVWREPATTRYHRHRIESMPPPGGGHHLIQMLNVFEGFELGRYPHGSPQHTHLLAEAMKPAYADRSKHSGDPGFVAVPTAWMTSKAYAAELRARIDPKAARPSRSIAGGTPPKEDRQTTHISVIDAAGNAVSSTQTINTGLGSKFVVPGTGVLLNNEMDDFALKPGAMNSFGLTGGKANAITPGKRPLSSMSPSLVYDPQGRLIGVLGTPGGSRIMSTIAQVISNRIDFAMAPRQAVFARRMHHQWLPDELRLEGGAWSESEMQSLRALGHNVRAGGRFCNVQAIFRDPESGVVTAVSDIRGTGRPQAE